MTSAAEIPMAARVETRHRWWWAPPLLLAVLIYLVLALWLAHTKAPWCDEGWFANPAYNLAFRGNLGSNVLEPSGFYLNAYFRGVQQRTYYAMPTDLVALAGWIRMFGLSAFSARVYSICWGAIALVVLFYVLKRLFPDRRVAVLGTLLTSIDFIFLWSTADVRMEAPANALALGSLATYLYFRERDYQKAVVSSQVLGACAVFTHPNAALVVLAVAIVAWRYDRDRLRLHGWRYLALAAAPYLVLGLLWSFYILQSPADFAAEFVSNAAGHNSERLRLFRPDIAVGMEIVRHLTAYYLGGLWAGVMKGWMVFVPFLYISAAVWFLWRSWRQDSSTQMFVTYAVALLLAMTFLNGFKGYFYLIYMVPLYNAMFAACLLNLWERNTSAKWIGGVAGLALVAIQLSISILHIRADEYHRDYEPTIRDVIRYRGEGKSIIGTAALGFGMGFRGFKDDVRLGMYSGLNPDVIILDRAYRYFSGFYKQDEPSVFEHIVTTLSTRYTLTAQHGSFWIFERAQPEMDGKPWIDGGIMESLPSMGDKFSTVPVHGK
jgi:hypothetical protein